MEVHNINYTLGCYCIADDRFVAEVEMKPDHHEIVKFVNHVRGQQGESNRILCGYEASGLGYRLYHQMIYHGIECIILAPSTITVTPGKIKTDQMDARWNSKYLAHHTYIAVYK